MKKSMDLGLSDLHMLEGCIEMAIVTWKRWLRTGDLPEEWTVDQTMDMIIALGQLGNKISAVTDSFNVDEPEEDSVFENLIHFPVPPEA